MESQQKSIFLAVNIIAIFLSGISCDLIVTHAPDHVEFMQKAGGVSLGEIPDVISTAFGFDIQKDLSWTGLKAGDIFKRPKANVLISVESPGEVKLELPHTAQYATLEDAAELNTESVVFNILNLVAEDEKPLVVDLSLDSRVLEVRSHHPDLFRDVPATTDKLRHVFTEGLGVFDLSKIGILNISNSADLHFLGEVHVIQAIVNALREKGSSIQGRLPNFFHFKVRGLQKLSDAYGSRSQQVHDAQILLQDFIQQVTQSLREVYADNVMVEVVTTSPQQPILSRKTRQILQTEAPPKRPALNQAAAYSGMYPVAFNIILWLMVILILTVIGICYGIWFMDPGRDSIIYRMTSQRMKKD